MPGPHEILIDGSGTLTLSWHSPLSYVFGGAGDIIKRGTGTVTTGNTSAPFAHQGFLRVEGGSFKLKNAGVIALTRTLAMENAKKGITVNCISPGMVAVAEPIPEPGTWVGRKGTADEMARAIVFLAADESGFITGADLLVEGGRILGPHNCDM